MADAKSKEEATSGNAFMIDARAAKIKAWDCWGEKEARANYALFSCPQQFFLGHSAKYKELPVVDRVEL